VAFLGMSLSFNNGTILDIANTMGQINKMPRTRMDELFAIAKSMTACSRRKRRAPPAYKILSWFVWRNVADWNVMTGRLSDCSLPGRRLAQYREAVLWAKASQGPEQIALSHETALLLYGISDRKSIACESYGSHVGKATSESAPEWVAIHRANLLSPGHRRA